MEITKDLEVEKLKDSDLLIAHYLLHKKFQEKAKGWSIEDFWNLHYRILNEFKKRGLEHPDIDELDRILKTKLSKIENNIKLLTDSLDDVIILKDAVSLIGSFLEKDDYQDIDILLRLNTIDYIKRAIMTRIAKQLEDKFDKELHFVFEPEGAHDDFIPLYDLVLKKIEPTNRVKMQFSDEHWDINLPPVFDFIIDFAELLKKVKGNTILDVGCGAGHSMKTLKRSLFDVTGIDINDKAIKHCKQLGLNVIKMNAEKLEFDDNSFDTVFSMHLLEHLDNVDKAIKESIRVAKLAVIHIIPLGKRVPKEHKRVYYKKDVIKLCKKFGMNYKIYRNGKYFNKFNAILWKFRKINQLSLLFQKPRYRIYDPKEIFKLKGFDKSLVQVKFDGVSTLIIKNGNKIKIISEDAKRDKSKLLPTLVDRLKTIPDGVYHAELVAVKTSKPLLRTVVSGYLNSKKYDINKEKLIHAFIVDIFQYKDKKLEDLPLSERLKYLNKAKSTSKVHVLSYNNLMGEIVDKKDIPKAINNVFKNKFAEGAMIKDLNAPASLQNKGMAKIKIWLEVDLRVLKKIINKAGNYNYIVGTEIDEKYAKDIGNKAVKMNGKYYMVLGKTMNTDLNVNPGAIIRLRVQEIHKAFKNKRPYYTIFLGRVHSDQSKTRVKEDGLITLENLYQKSKKPI
ncbi:MAG: methyltransferase domain-containing protein [Promethearchaeota archaeon]